MKFLKTSIAIFLLISVTSCATVFKGRKEKVTFHSEPEGASVYINGVYINKTPFYTKLPSAKLYVVDIVRDSVTKQQVVLSPQFTAKYLVADLLLCTTFYLSPVILVDVFTKAWYKLDQNGIYVRFK